MKITANLAFILAAIFASVCFAVAIKGYLSLDEITDPTQLADSKGFAFFWAFLGMVGLVSGIGSWWLIRRQPEE